MNSTDFFQFYELFYFFQFHEFFFKVVFKMRLTYYYALK